MSDVTRILSAIKDGDSRAAEQLWPLVYDELRRLASQKLVNERPGQTLQATALVHEAYLRLVGPNGQPAWDCRGHFFAAAAEAMRRILIEQARRRTSQKRSGDRGERISLDEAATLLESEVLSTTDLLALDEALTRLAAEAPEKAELVKLRYFAGLTLEEAAKSLGISLATAKRYWVYARATLYEQLHEFPESEGPPSSA
jgi:RNA polymerase sigma factor (TIGR02999 family)